MGAKETELKRLWDLILTCERQMPAKTPEEFAAKKRELDRLHAEYKKVSGLPCDPNDQKFNEQMGDRKFIDDGLGRGDRVQTDDSMNRNPYGG